MRINYSKSELIPINMDDQELADFLSILVCNKGNFPIKYLGIPLHYDKLRREDIQPLLDKIIKRIAGWRGKLLSYRGRLILIQACLASIPVYLLSFFKFPKWAVNLINSQMSHCLWNDFEGNRKLHLANWALVSMKKDFGGLGIPNLQEINICLLGSWIKRFYEEDLKPWKLLIAHKYLGNKPNIFVPSSNPKTSRFWKGLKSIMHAVKFGYRWNIGDGSRTRFWEDTWFGTSPLAVQFWPIYSVCNELNKSFNEVWDGQCLKLSFRRNFSDSLMEQWFQLEEIAKSITFTAEPDALIWQLDNKGKYSSSSLYHVINFRGVQPVFIPAIWKLRVPPKIHVFLWLLSKNKLMTRDNLRKRHIIKPLDCVYCLEQESCSHLFFECIVAKHLWAHIEEYFSSQIGSSFKSVARFWIATKKCSVLNTVSSAVLWCL